MDRTEARRRMAAARVGRMATFDVGGGIHLAPFTFVLAGETIWWAVDRKPKRTTRLRRLENIRARPEMTVLVDDYDEDWSRLWWVRARGQARVIESGPELQEAVRLLQEKYERYRREPPDGPAVRVDVTEWRWWAAG